MDETGEKQQQVVKTNCQNNWTSTARFKLQLLITASVDVLLL